MVCGTAELIFGTSLLPVIVIVIGTVVVRMLCAKLLLTVTK